MAIRTRPIVGLDLAALGTTATSSGVRLLALESIDEDPGQPRTEFDTESLEELAVTIRERGVLSPVSVRPHPRDGSRWMLNFGARRLRAARLAGRHDIPAFVDAAFDSYSQVIENEQREGLKPLELALFIARRKALGESQADVARLLGKSRPYVAMASALIDAPDWLMDLYRGGACRGLNELYRLRLLAERAPAQVKSWSRGRTAVSRSDLCRLSDLIEADGASPPGDVDRTTDSEGEAHLGSAAPLSVPRPWRPAPTLLARCGDEVVEVHVRDAPIDDGHVFVRSKSSSERRSVPAASVHLVGFLKPG